MKLEDKVCRDCGVELNDDTWYPSFRKMPNHICKKCNIGRTELWRKANPGPVQAQRTRARRRVGHQSMNKNRECSAFLGVHIAERVLSHVFKNVERMPYGNPGYDVICNHGKKIDVKSSCLRSDGEDWVFHINRNTTADFFLCLAFDNREDLIPLYAWLIPGSKLNHLTSTGIRPSTVHRWDEYQLASSNIRDCCDMIRGV